LVFHATINDLVSGQYAGTFEKILDFERYIIITNHLLATISLQFPFIPILFFLILILAPKKIFSGLLLVLTATFIVYLVIYVVTPHDLTWHLRTSMSRLIHQLYPSYLYCIAFIVCNYFRQHPALYKLQ